MRLIDADKLRKFFECEETMCKLQEAILGILDAQETANRWIPVTERLPEPDSLVLITLEDVSIPDIAEYSGTWQDDIKFRPADDSYDAYAKEVIAWMPLPEIYKEG